MKRLSAYQYHQNYRESASSAFKSQGRMSKFIDATVNYFWRSIPFSVKIFLSKDIGSMTYSWAMIIFAALWSRFILDGYMDPTEFAPPEAMFRGYIEKGSPYYNIAYPFWLLVMLAIQFAYVVINFIPPSFYIDGPQIVDQEVNYFAFFFSLLILVVGMLHKRAVARKHKSRIPFDPLYEGKSFLLIGLKWGADRFGFGPDAYDEMVINEERASRRMESGFLLILAIIFYEIGSSYPDLENFFWFFGIGSIGLFLDNLRLMYQKRRDLEARFATEFRARKLDLAYQEYRESKTDEIATVSYAASQSYEKEFVLPAREAATVSMTNNHM